MFDVSDEQNFGGKFFICRDNNKVKTNVVSDGIPTWHQKNRNQAALTQHHWQVSGGCLQPMNESQLDFLCRDRDGLQAKTTTACKSQHNCDDISAEYKLNYKLHMQIRLISFLSGSYKMYESQCHAANAPYT